MLEIKPEVRNRKPRSEGPTQLQGMFKHIDIGDSSNYSATTELKASSRRYDKRVELYKSGRVSIGSNSLFKVSRFAMDTEKIQCDCPDYRTLKQTCKHIFICFLFAKNRGKQTIEQLDDHSNDSNGNSAKIP